MSAAQEVGQLACFDEQRNGAQVDGLPGSLSMLVQVPWLPVTSQRSQLSPQAELQQMPSTQ